MILGNITQYIPPGSYLETSDRIEVTITATCSKSTGGSNVSSLKYTVLKSEAIGDIANIEGVLTIHEGDGKKQNPTQKYSKFIPPGSYQLTSSNIRIELSAFCRTVDGMMVQSHLRYIPSLPITDILNDNGHLLCD